MLEETLDHIAPTFLATNSADLNAVDYKIWSAMQQKVYKHLVKDITELRERIVAPWDELKKHIIDTAVRQSSTWLCACVKTVGGHFCSTIRDLLYHISCTYIIGKYRDININSYCTTKTAYSYVRVAVFWITV